MELIFGDCLDKLKTMESNSVDSIVTDPPAGISFMGKEWDDDKGGRDNWIKWLSEILIESRRVLKPGGHALIWALPRTSHWTGFAIENAGFEVKDVITHLFGSGFPKSQDIKKSMSKQIGQEVAKQWEGFGTALKPASEHWILCRNPLEKGLTIAENVFKWGTGAINIDACRIQTTDNLNGGAYSAGREARAMSPMGAGVRDTVVNAKFVQHQGRWPSNLILDEEAAALLDEQSGVLKNGGQNETSIKGNGMFLGTGGKDGTSNFSGDSGGASRFFKVIESDCVPTRFLYQAKASKSERNKGLEGMEKKLTGTMAQINKPLSHGSVHGQTGKPNKPMEPQQNFHPTVKAIKLMEYLIKLVTPPNGTILDPFMGSGSTGVAAKQLGFNFIGIEKDPEYFEIAKNRIENN